MRTRRCALHAFALLVGFPKSKTSAMARVGPLSLEACRASVRTRTVRIQARSGFCRRILRIFGPGDGREFSDAVVYPGRQRRQSRADYSLEYIVDCRYACPDQCDSAALL